MNQQLKHREYIANIRERILTFLSEGVKTTEEVRRHIVEDKITVGRQLRVLRDEGKIESNHPKNNHAELKWRIKRATQVGQTVDAGR